MSITLSCFLDCHIHYSRLSLLNQQNYPYELCSIEAPIHIRHQVKRREYAYSRSLLYQISPELKAQGIRLQSQKKPIATSNKPYFSISHSGDWIATIINYVNTVSVDIQLHSEVRLAKIASRFLSSKEQAQINLLDSLTSHWSIKECIYKYFFPQYSIPFRLMTIEFPKTIKPSILQQPLLSLQAPYQNLSLPQIYLYSNSQWVLSFIA